MLHVILLSAAAASGTPADATDEAAEKPKKVTCRYEGDISSRITRKKICLTEDQRRERERDNRRTMSTVGQYNQPGN